MSDNTTLNVGSGGDVYGSDDISSVKYQRVKLIHGVDGTNDGDVAATNPLPVKGKLVTVSVDVVRPSADATQYGINDALSDSTSAPTSGGFTITNAARASGGSGVILEMVCTTSADQGTPPSLEAVIFDTAVTNINDNAAFVVSDAEVKTIIGTIPVSLEDFGNNGFGITRNLSLPFTTVGSANLRFLVRMKNSYTPVSATPGETFTFRFKILQVD
jgi:hypothetical protein